MENKKLMLTGTIAGSALMLNGCSWMGGGAMAGAIGHMVFGAVVALAGVFIYGRWKK